MSLQNKSKRRRRRHCRATSGRSASISWSNCRALRPARCSASSCASCRAVLRLVAVTKNFGPRAVLNAVSLEVGAGEYVAILGESGIGKSTLLNVIAGLEPVDAGKIFLDGVEITSLSDDARTLLRRDRFGFVFQAFHVLPQLSVEENVGLPLLLKGNPSRESARKAIASVG